MLLACGSQDWHNHTAVARAFSIGKAESQAVSQLMTAVHPDVLKHLTLAVKKRGMPKLVLHDAIAREIFSEGYSSGQGCMEAWKDQLTNLKGRPNIVSCLWLIGYLTL